MRSGLNTIFLVVIFIFTVNVAQASEVSKEVWINGFMKYATLKGEWNGS